MSKFRTGVKVSAEWFKPLDGSREPLGHYAASGTQGFEPPSPPYVRDVDAEFEPYAVGYVELPGILRVEGRLTESRPERLRIGMEMEVVVSANGGRPTFAFRVVEDE